MRANEFLYETIDIIFENTSADDLIPHLQSLGFKVKKITRNKVKVVVPSKFRFSSAKSIAGSLPGAEVSPDGKIVTFDGATIMVKPAEAQGGGLEKEAGQIISIESSIKEHLNGKTDIKLQVGNRLINAAGINKVPGNVKADAVIVDSSGKEQAWISLKDGTTPKGFGQWGGVNHLGREPEVIAFVEGLKSAFPGGFVNKMGTYGAPIQNNKLKSLTCFGKNFGGEPGISNVDLILQGHPTLKKGPHGTYILEGSQSWANGVTPSGEYEPTLMARYGADRNDFGVKTCRIYSYPKDGRPWKPVPAPTAKQPIPAQPAPAAPAPQQKAPAQLAPAQPAPTTQQPPEIN
jgi:hypothetical protein